MLVRQLVFGVIVLLTRTAAQDGNSQNNVSKLQDVPEPGLFLRRSLAKATLIGNYLYIDGGEISQNEMTEAGPVFNRGRPSNPVNSTISIDMSVTWSTASVKMRAIPKPPGIPSKSHGHIWTDLNENAFYSWGGFRAYADETGEKTLYKFTADGQGGGNWSVEVANNPEFFQTLRVVDQGAFANTDTTAYVLGGWSSKATEAGVGNQGEPIPGMISFDMKSKEFRAGTTGFSPYGTAAVLGASMQHVPGFAANGGKGFMLVLGGMLDRSTGANEDRVPLNMSNLVLFDAVTMERYEQTATGEIPPTPRKGFCSAGFQNKEGGYEIFISGGQNDNRGGSRYGDAYVLSLPGFVWSKLPDQPAGPRAGHTCVPVGVGKRKVISIGGARAAGTWQGSDPAAQGLMLFDMTTWEWNRDYDALDERPYEAATKIKEWYGNGSLAKVQWSSAEVQKVFANANFSSPTSEAAPDSSSTSAAEAGGSATPIGAIIGGTVGGIAAVVVIVGIVVWIRIRQRRERQDHIPTDGIGGNGEKCSGPVVFMGGSELEGNNTTLPSELPATYKYVPATAHEAAAEHGYSELPDDRRHRSLVF